jgi:hypothetical protein
VEVGNLLLKAKKKLLHGEFTAMINRDLPFSDRTADCLMSIAKCPWLNPHTCAGLPTARLPASWRTLYELSRLSKRAFNSAARRRFIHAEMTVRDATNLAHLDRSRRRRARVTSALPAAPVTPSVATVSARGDVRKNRSAPDWTQRSAEDQADTILQQIQNLRDSLAEADVVFLAERISETHDDEFAEVIDDLMESLSSLNEASAKRPPIKSRPPEMPSDDEANDKEPESKTKH